jgi:phage-related protein
MAARLDGLAHHFEITRKMLPVAARKHDSSLFLTRKTYFRVHRARNVIEETTGLIKEIIRSCKGIVSLIKKMMP